MQNVKNRAWVKNAAILFLAVLLVLTFFSNTIMNRSLAEVATQGVSSGPVTVRVRGTGVVTAVGAYELKAEQTRKIQSVLVRAGQEVNAGDVLFVLGEGASEELEQAAENLRQLELSYKRAAAGMPVFNYELDQHEIDEAKKAEADALAAMQAALSELTARDTSLSTYEDDMRAAEAQLNKALGAREDVRAVIAEEREEAWQTIETVQLLIRVLEARESELTDQLAAEQPAPTQTPVPTETPAPTESPALAAALAPGATPAPTEAPAPSETPVPTETPLPTETPGAGELNAAGMHGSVRLAPSHPAILKLGLSTVGMSDEEKAQVEQMEADLDRELMGYATTAAKLQRVRELLEDARLIDSTARAQMSSEDSDPRMEQANEAVTAAQAKVDALLKKLGPYADNYIAARDAYEDAKNRRETLEIQLKQTKASNGRSAASSAIELQDLTEQIARAKQKLEELSGGVDNQVTAPVGGIIDSIGYTAGNTAPKGEILCKIQVPDMGYTLSFSVTNEQARRLRTGDTATVSNYYWGREILATLDTIQTDPQAPQTNKQLTFTVTGDVNPGSELTIAVGSRSQNYDIIVPNSAIRSDTNGSFVLRLEAKNSPLGNRYYARRVEVSVLAQDDVNAAVSGDLSYGDFVITTSDRPVSVGDQVRMTDNG